MLGKDLIYQKSTAVLLRFGVMLRMEENWEGIDTTKVQRSSCDLGDLLRREFEFIKLQHF